jgi:Domain of unknown function (DUF4258)
MKPIRWTPHARKKLSAREITEREVERTIAHPDSVILGRSPRRVFLRRYHDAVLKTEMLLLVVTEETASDFVIVTLYKTSKFKKYERGAKP